MSIIRILIAVAPISHNKRKTFFSIGEEDLSVSGALWRCPDSTCLGGNNEWLSSWKSETQGQAERTVKNFVLQCTWRQKSYTFSKRASQDVSRLQVFLRSYYFSTAKQIFYFTVIFFAWKDDGFYVFLHFRICACKIITTCSENCRQSYLQLKHQHKAFFISL